MTRDLLHYQQEGSVLSFASIAGHLYEQKQKCDDILDSDLYKEFLKVCNNKYRMSGRFTTIQLFNFGFAVLMNITFDQNNRIEGLQKKDEVALYSKQIGWSSGGNTIYWIQKENRKREREEGSAETASDLSPRAISDAGSCTVAEYRNRSSSSVSINNNISQTNKN